MDLSEVTWRKAGHSGGNGGACVEVAVWRKASYSGDNGGNCVEVGVWRKTTHSGANGGDCVEVGTADAQIAVRDSKDPNGPKLSFTPSAWRNFMIRSREASRF